ncbi:unnamed protein product [Ixodes pacificus]
MSSSRKCSTCSVDLSGTACVTMKRVVTSTAAMKYLFASCELIGPTWSIAMVSVTAYVGSVNQFALPCLRSTFDTCHNFVHSSQHHGSWSPKSSIVRFLTVFSCDPHDRRRDTTQGRSAQAFRYNDAVPFLLAGLSHMHKPVVNESIWHARVGSFFLRPPDNRGECRTVSLCMVQLAVFRSEGENHVCCCRQSRERICHNICLPCGVTYWELV